MTQPSRRSFLKRTLATAGGVCVANNLLHASQADIPPAAIARLRSKVQGSLVLPSEAAYEQVKRVFYWNPRTERHPQLIVRCGAEEDVRWAVEFARAHDLEVSVRSGGHSHLAWGSSHGVVIDVSPLKRIEVDAKQGILRAQGGVFGGEAARAATPYGLAPVFGQCPGVSATGVSLGGGLGWLSGLFGACCDNLIAARVVTADGELLDVNAENNPELLWGLRGAGANFGVATSFTSQLHQLGPVLGGDFHYGVRDARQVLRGFSQIMREAPDGFQATLNLTNSERGLFISFCHAGDVDEGEQLLKKLRTIAKPTREAVQQQPYAQLAEKAAATTSGQAAAPAFRAVQTCYRDEITETLIDTIVDQLNGSTADVVMGLSHYMHGQVCRVEPNATAFPHRQAHSIHLRAAFNWTDPNENEQRFAWGEQWLQALRSTTNEKVYANYQTYEPPTGSPAIFAENHPRLLALKRQYDSTNFFRRNANVTPT